MEIVICLHAKHLNVLMNSLKRVRSRSNWNLDWSVGFWGEGEIGVPVARPLGGRERTNKKTTQIWFDAAIWSRGHISGRRVLSSLRYPCALALFKSSCDFHQLRGFYFHEVPGTGILIMHFGMFRWYQVSSLNFQFFSLSLFCIPPPA